MEIEKERVGISDGKNDEQLQAQLSREKQRVARAKLAQAVAESRRGDMHRSRKTLEKTKRRVFDYLKTEISTTFDDFLLDGNSSGTFIMDVKKKTLDIKVTARVGNIIGDMDKLLESSSLVSQLSGGEATRTMMAFLLSIIRSATTPFFVMDEVCELVAGRNNGLRITLFSIYCCVT